MTTWKKLFAILALLSLVAAACGDDDAGETANDGNDANAQQDGDDSSGDDSSGDDSSGDDSSGDDSSGDDPGGEDGDVSPFGDADPAAGEPLRIGFISDGQSEAIDNSSETPAAEAASAYVNEYLGGVAGRPIELVPCDTEQTPAGAQDCTAELISEGVAAILNGVSGQIDPVVTGAEEAGIPLVQWGGISEAALLNANTYVIGNSLAAIVGPAKLAADAGMSKAAIVVIDVPAATGPIGTIAPLFYGNVGIDTEIVAIAPGTPDMTPEIQVAITNGAEQFAIIGDETFCTSAMSAIQTLGFDGPVVVIVTCLGESTAAEVDLEGFVLLGSTSDNSSDPEVALFEAVMAEYASGSPTDSIAVGGYGVVLAFVRAMSGHGDGEVTPASIHETMVAMDPAQMPMTPDGSTFQCNRLAVVIAPATCSAGSIITTLDAEGQSTGYSSLDLTDVLTLG